ncbi:MAG: AAA family ATPase [Anaerolineae bacterium]|nr:MAG: AAA family ATPase [Anaerolineae bacterium]
MPSKLLSLLEDHSAAQRVLSEPPKDLGIASIEPFPFLAIMGQQEMKLALILALINPKVGGVLLVGSRGTAKTTAVRSLVDLLPLRRHSICPEGCTEEMFEQNGMDAICKDCAKKVGYGEPLTVEERVRIFELPLNARLEDVVGGINERLALEQQRLRLDRGILAQADGNILYIDEVNLLERNVSNAILDAAAQGYYTVRRGPMSLEYRSQFILVGSMNPAEGQLRPQILDRFGLRAVARGLPDHEARYRAYQRAISYRTDPEEMSAIYADATMALAEEIDQASLRIHEVEIEEEAKRLGLELIQELNIESNRAEITLFEAAKAYCASDERITVQRSDIETVALMSLRLRQSDSLHNFYRKQEKEDQLVLSLIAAHN